MLHEEVDILRGEEDNMHLMDERMQELVKNLRHN